MVYRYTMSDDPRVLPADAPRELTLGWVVKEYLGAEIYRPNDTDTPLTSRDDVKLGDEVWVPVIGGYFAMIVKQLDDGRLYADSDWLSAYLEFGGDDRGSWCSVGVVNKRGLEKLRITP